MMGLSDIEWKELRTLQFEFNMRRCAVMEIDVNLSQEELNIHNEKIKKIFNKKSETMHKKEEFNDIF